MPTHRDSAMKLYKAQKPLLDKKLGEQGMMLLYAVAWPPQGIYAKKPINSAAQAWLPKNAVPVNRAAFNALDKPTQDALLKAGAEAEARGWAASQAENTRTQNLLKQNGMNIVAPSQIATWLPSKM